jgi:hypothetical protein
MFGCAVRDGTPLLSSEVSQAINSTLDRETMLSTIVTKAVQLSDVDAAVIYVLD